MTSSRKRPNVKVSEGDIFEMLLPDGGRGFGQIIVTGKLLYIVIFRELYDRVPDLDELIKTQILLVGWTVDALLFHGRWNVIGNRPVMAESVPFPSYKILVEGRMHVQDFEGRRLQPATPVEIELLENKTTVAPIRYQNAFLAWHGKGKWEPDYDRLTLQHVQRRVRSWQGVRH